MEATVRHRIAKLPRVLTLHLKRFDSTATGVRYRTTSLHFTSLHVGLKRQRSRPYSVQSYSEAHIRYRTTTTRSLRPRPRDLCGKDGRGRETVERHTRPKRSDPTDETGLPNRSNCLACDLR